MKNYLFRPFQNDNEKEDVFKEYQDNHKHLDNSQVIGFICRLESTYDVIISELRSKCAVAVADERIIRELKAENERLNGLLETTSKQNKKLHYLIEENDKLKAENVELKEGLSNEGVLMLQDDNKRLMSDNKKRLNEIIELTDDNKRLMKQVSSNRSNNSNGRTISGEIDEYMSHNEGCGGARLFLIPRDEFNDGEYDNTIYWDDGIE